MPRRGSATLKVFREIPDELKGTNVRLDRLATEIIAVARAVGDDHERRPAAFERRGA